MSSTRRAQDEAALRDGLRRCRPLDPPSSVWAGVQRQLAVAEVADADKPAWRRTLARWMPMAPRFGLATAALVASQLAVGVLVWRSHRVETVTSTAPTLAATGSGSACAIPTAPQPQPQPIPTDEAGDVTAELVAAPARTTASYGAAADELSRSHRMHARTGADDRKAAFDTRLAELCHDVDGAAEGRPRQKAYRTMIRYLQGVTIRDEIAANDLQLAAPRVAR